MLPVNTALETMIEHAISTLDGKSFPGKVRFLFVTRDASPEQAVAAELARVAAKHGFEYDTHNLDILTEGPASTVYEAKHLMDPEAQLIISNSDQILKNVSASLLGAEGRLLQRATRAKCHLKFGREKPPSPRPPQTVFVAKVSAGVRVG